MAAVKTFGPMRIDSGPAGAEATIRVPIRKVGASYKACNHGLRVAASSGANVRLTVEVVHGPDGSMTTTHSTPTCLLGGVPLVRQPHRGGGGGRARRGGTVVLVMSTGTATLDLDAEVVQYIPDWLVADGHDLVDFQAREVWRRLCAGIAAGADGVGWQAWMSFPWTEDVTKHHTEGYGMGLREDMQTLTTSAQNAVPRPSRGAFVRLTQVLAGVTTGNVRAVVPSPPITECEHPRASGGALIFEFARGLRPRDGFAFTYVLLMDVTAAGDALTRVQLDWKRAGHRERRALVMDPFPTTTTYDDSDPDALPSVAYTFAEAELTLPLNLWIVPEFDILVLNTTEQLEVSILPDPSPEWDGAARRPADSSESSITIGDILESLRNGYDPRDLS